MADILPSSWSACQEKSSTNLLICYCTGCGQESASSGRCRFLKPPEIRNPFPERSTFPSRPPDSREAAQTYSRELSQGSKLQRWRVRRHRAAGPLLPGGIIGEQFDEDASHHGARLKGAVFPRVRVIEISEGEAIGSLIYQLDRGREQRFKVGRLIRESGGPEQPVQLRVKRSGIEWKTKCILFGEVEFDLGTRHVRGEKV